MSEGLKVNPTHPSLLFVRARALWEHPDGYKSEAYSALLQVRTARHCLLAGVSYTVSNRILQKWLLITNNILFILLTLQAAKTDPTNPEVFLYLGHYQKVVTGDLK